MMKNSMVKTPWIRFYGKSPSTITYPKTTLYHEFMEACNKYGDYVAYEFFGVKTTYKEALKQVSECAKALKVMGIKKGDKVTICMPNCPQALIMFYAVNMIGAIDNMIHPLSSPKEIKFFLEDSNSVAALTLDQFFYKFNEIKNDYKLDHLIISSVTDALSPLKAFAYKITSGRKIKKVYEKDNIILWNNFINSSSLYKNDDVLDSSLTYNDQAVILYSGGTTGVCKGISLSNYNFNSLGKQIVKMNYQFIPGDSMLAAMPIFHGFGLGVSIHSMLANGGRCILVPRFTVDSYATLIKNRKPNFISGVPSLFEALLKHNGLKKSDLSFLKGIYSGGDSLSIELKERIDKFLKARKCKVHIQEGYGATECVAASCLTPNSFEKKGSIGIPLPDMYFKIVKPGTDEEVPYGTEGEICINGPTVMLGYVNQPEETANTLRVHKDGLTWLHTGDLGIMDSDGFVYFRQRIKRMIVTNGYNVYPSQIEKVLMKHHSIAQVCVIGVKDPIKIQRVIACIVLKPGFKESDELKKDILALCKKYIARYALPYDMEFRESIPKTKVGKIAYHELEIEENLKEKALA